MLLVTNVSTTYVQRSHCERQVKSELCHLAVDGVKNKSGLSK